MRVQITGSGRAGVHLQGATDMLAGAKVSYMHMLTFEPISSHILLRTHEWSVIKAVTSVVMILPPQQMHQCMMSFADNPTDVELVRFN
jgi:hypothetical protein